MNKLFETVNNIDSYILNEDNEVIDLTDLYYNLKNDSDLENVTAYYKTNGGWRRAENPKKGVAEIDIDNNGRERGTFYIDRYGEVGFEHYYNGKKVLLAPGNHSFNEVINAIKGYKNRKDPKFDIQSQANSIIRKHNLLKMVDIMQSVYHCMSSIGEGDERFVSQKIDKKVLDKIDKELYEINKLSRQILYILQDEKDDGDSYGDFSYKV